MDIYKSMVGSNEYNFIDKNGNCNTDWISQFVKGIDNDGNRFCRHYGYTYGSCGCFAKVQRRDGLYNFLTLDGKILYPQEWFYCIREDDLDKLSKMGYIKVQREDRKWNVLSSKGKLVFDKWFKDIYIKFNYSLSPVKCYGECWDDNYHPTTYDLSTLEVINWVWKK